MTEYDKKIHKLRKQSFIEDKNIKIQHKKKLPKKKKERKKKKKSMQTKIGH